MSSYAVAEGLARTAQIVVGLGKEMVEGIPSDRFARFAHGADGPIHSNHPAFVMGHLSLYPGRVASLIGLELDVAVPAAWDELFAPGAACEDDPGGTVYPEKAELIARFVESHKALFGPLAEVSAEVFERPTPIDRYRERFPTILSAATFLLVGHPMIHIGQVSAWRRFEGMPSLK